MLRQPVRLHPLAAILALSFLVRTLAAVANVGFMAIDDYVYMLKLAFPAQEVPSISQIIASSWVHPTIPMLVLTWLGQLPLRLGVTDPLHQIQFVYFLMGLFSLLPVYLAYRLFSDLGRRKEGLVAAGLVGLHCIMPFFSTRVLFETFAMPLIFVSLYFFQSYYRAGSKRFLLLAVAAITAASLVRYQSGVCYLAMAGFFFFSRRCRKDWLYFILISGIFFVVSGLLDFAIGRDFHQSFIDYVKYNLEHSSDYGVSKPWNFALFFVGVSLPPFLLRRWRGFDWRERYRSLLPALSFFLVFLISHSLIPHKEDRFMIPILPVFLLLLAPLVYRLFEEGAKTRLKIFAGLNVFILVLASFFTAQWNTIGVARFLHENRQIRKLVNFHGSLTFVPTAYMNRPDIEVSEVTSADESRAFDCDEIWAVRQDHLAAFQVLNLPVQKIGESSPGPLEWLVVKLNPKRNGRRAAISLYGKPGCGHSF